MARAVANKQTGSAFEDLFFKQAQRNGLLVIKNYISAQYTYKGRLQAVPSDLDFKLISQLGQVGYFDAKTYQEDHFVYSQLEEHQLARAVLYNNWSVQSGFVVWLRKVNLVVFFSGHVIARKGPGSRFKFEDGLVLGRWENFDLRPLLSV
jgi:hypothetical protein